ncbi:hypothetical protein [Streptomyces sp. NPDC005322]|uniref:hypothetical protein n=1 Tax=unclassified Streptomyces TaxID=2593676 RepID=UPI0033AFF8B7
MGGRVESAATTAGWATRGTRQSADTPASGPSFAEGLLDSFAEGPLDAVVAHGSADYLAGKTAHALAAPERGLMREWLDRIADRGPLAR